MVQIVYAWTDLEPSAGGWPVCRSSKRMKDPSIMTIFLRKTANTMCHFHQMYRRRVQENKHKKVQNWEKKTHRSPFLINLLAEVISHFCCGNLRIDVQGKHMCCVWPDIYTFHQHMVKSSFCGRTNSNRAGSIRPAHKAPCRGTRYLF